MAQFIYYKDGDDEQKGPLNEKHVLGLYNRAEFTSDVIFQIRTSASDSTAPFVRLRDLISKNGPSNPFRDDSADLDRRIAAAEKELAELRHIDSKKAELEKRVAEIEREIEERKKNHVSGSKQGGTSTTKSSAQFKESTPNKKTPEQIKEGIEHLKNKFPGIKVEPFSMENETMARVYRDSLHKHCEEYPLVLCLTCGLMLATWKQMLLHVNLSCHRAIPEDLKKKFEADIPRWKKEDADRIKMGSLLFSRLNANEQGKARPQTDFIEDINMKLKNEMVLNTDQGRFKTMEFLNSDAATKIKERVEKHLREAKGLLVCSKCKIASKTASHFLNHLTTHEHRLNVIGTPFELISLLLGWFNRQFYLQKVQESEIDVNEEPNPINEAFQSLNIQMSGSGGMDDEERESSSDEEVDEFDEEIENEEEEEEEDHSQCNHCHCSSEEREEMIAMATRQNIVDGFSYQTILSCTECNAMYTNFKQFLVHLGSDQHVESVSRVDQSRQEAEEDRQGHEKFIKLFHTELQKWRWTDGVGLTGGRRMYDGWNENEKKDAKPTKEFIERLSNELGMTIKKKANGKYEEYFLLAEEYFTSYEAKKLMDRVENHLKVAKKFVCTACKFGSKDSDAFFIHCMAYNHVKITQGSIYELPTILFGVYKKDLM